MFGRIVTPFFEIFLVLLLSGPCIILCALRGVLILLKAVHSTFKRSSSATPREKRTIVITGASSGIGAAIAKKYSSESRVRCATTLALIGRNAERLREVSEVCSEQGAASVETLVSDVRDRGRITTWLREFDARHPIDIVVHGAGVNGPQAATEIAAAGGGLEVETSEVDRVIMETNVIGFLNVVSGIEAGMRRRGRGKIAVIGSLASSFNSGGYSASKAAIEILGRSMRSRLSSAGISVVVIEPGFVDTPMVQALGPNTWTPFTMTAEAAATMTIEGIEHSDDCPVVKFPVIVSAASIAARFIPTEIFHMISDPIGRWMPFLFGSHS